MTDEITRLAAPYGRYGITKSGEVWSFVHSSTGKKLRPTIGPCSGYVRVGLSHGGEHRMLRVHRLVLETFAGPCPVGYITRHLDGDPANNALENLCWGTHAQNMADRKFHGTDSMGERNGMSVLTDDEVREIRLAYAAGDVTQQVLADSCGVARSQISRILAGKLWKHIDAKES